MTLAPVTLSMYQGDDRRIIITASESLDGSTVRFTARRNKLDEEAVIEKSTVAGSVTVGVPDDMTAVALIDASDTEGMAPTLLRWDVEVTDVLGKVKTVAIGYLKIMSDVTRVEAS